jgi:hypothetical protein
LWITACDPVGCFLVPCAEIHSTAVMITVRYEGARKRVNSFPKPTETGLVGAYSAQIQP